MPKHEHTTPTINGTDVPPGATHFELYALAPRTGTNAAGKRYRTFTAKRLKGKPDRDGKVTTRWLVADCTPVKIRRQWGPGRYRVRFLTETGEQLGVAQWELETPAGEATAGARLEGGGDVAQVDAGDPTSRVRAMAGRLDGGSALDLVLLLQDSADRARAIAREEAAANAERDRQFFTQQQSQFQTLLAMVHGGGHAPAAAAAGPAVDLRRELDLMRRENALTLREEMARLRDELRDDDDDDTPPRPETAAQALDQAGVAGVEAFGEAAPELVAAGLGALKRWLTAQGQPATPENVAGVIEAVRRAAIAEAQTNGAPHDQDA